MADTHRETLTKKVMSIRVDRALFYVALMLWIITSVLSSSLYLDRLPLTLGKVTAVALFAYSEILFGKKTNRDFLVLSVTIATVALAVSSGQDAIGLTLGVIYCGRNIELRSLLKWSLVFELTAVLFVLASWRLGVLENLIYYRGSVVRNSLGFSYCTFLGHYNFNMALMYIYLRYQKITDLEFAWLAVIAIVIFEATDSRNAFILTMACVLVCWYFKHIRTEFRLPVLARSLCHYSYILLASISILAALLVNPYEGIGTAIDSAFSGRITLAQQAIRQFGVSLLGKDVDWIGRVAVSSGTYSADSYNYVDNSYIQILISGGAVVFLILLALFTRALSKAVLRGDDLLVFMFALYALHSFIDPQMMNIEYGGFLFVLFSIEHLSENQFRPFRYVPSDNCRALAR